MTSPAICLAVRGLGHAAPNGDTLLRDVSFALPRGAVLAIAGPNGAGKSTLLNLLAGITPLSAGEVMLEGRDLSRMSATERARQIAVVSQQSAPDGRLRLRDYVALGQMPRAGDRSPAQNTEALARILALTGLDPKADKLMAQLSGGERQRAHIARALAQEPLLLFLDEPTNHLDPDAKGRMLSLVAGLGITVVMVVHDLVMIPEFATHAALMKSAQLTAFGTADTVLTPDSVREIFGVSFLRLPHEGRNVPALDIRRSDFPLSD